MTIAVASAVLVCGGARAEGVRHYRGVTPYGKAEMIFRGKDARQPQPHPPASPTNTPQRPAPNPPSSRCADGAYDFNADQSTACSHHGGLAPGY